MRRPAGLQPERTALAWRRTALALATGAVLVVHASGRTGAHGRLLASLMVLAALSAGTCAEMRRRAVLPADAAHWPSTLPAELVAGLAASTTLVGGGALLLLWWR